MLKAFRDTLGVEISTGAPHVPSNAAHAQEMQARRDLARLIADGAHEDEVRRAAIGVLVRRANGLVDEANDLLDMARNFSIRVRVLSDLVRRTALMGGGSPCHRLLGELRGAPIDVGNVPTEVVLAHASLWRIELGRLMADAWAGTARDIDDDRATMETAA